MLAVLASLSTSFDEDTSICQHGFTTPHIIVSEASHTLQVIKQLRLSLHFVSTRDPRMPGVYLKGDA